MSGPGWYKRDPRRALRGMKKLTLEQRGFYQTLQDMIYDEGGSIEDDETYLAGQMMIGKRRYRILRDQLLELGRITRDYDGRITDEACEDTLAEWAERREKQAAGGRSGGYRSGETRKKRAKKSEKTREILGKNEVILEAEISEIIHLGEARLPKKVRSIEDRDTAPSGAVCAAAPPTRPLDRCLAVAGPGLADPSKHSSLHLTAPRIAAAMAGGCDLDLDILPVISARTAKARASPITTWGYFERAWCEARDQRLAGVAPPNPNVARGTSHAGRRNSGSMLSVAMRAVDQIDRRRGADGAGDAEPRAGTALRIVGASG